MGGTAFAWFWQLAARSYNPAPGDRPMRLIVTTVLCLACAVAPAATVRTAAPDRAAVEALIGQGQEWLLAQQQANGAFLPGNRFAVGITAMAVEVLSRPPAAIAKDDPRIVK